MSVVTQLQIRMGSVIQTGFRSLAIWLARLLVIWLPALLMSGLTGRVAVAAPANGPVATTASLSGSAACRKPVYLTLDTGNMRDAIPIADFLKSQGIRATFFLANEKAYQGGFALDSAWADYWRERAREGHVFGSHTLRHGRIFPDAADTQTQVVYRPQFGDQAGQRLKLSAGEFCQELKAVSAIFQSYTGQPLSGIWRAPGGKLSNAAMQASRQCGYVHVGWSETGFLGDELDSSRFPNAVLVKKALSQVRAGDILLAHLGIWSRQEHFLPAFRDIISGLQEKGFCFRTLKEHPDYAGAF